MKCFEQLYSQGHVNGSVNYAFGLHVGYNGVPEPRTVASVYKLTAEKGSILGMYYFACLLENGDLGQTFPEEALKYYKMAAEQRSKEACFRLKIYDKPVKPSKSFRK
jgi:TPR repeat protein